MEMNNKYNLESKTINYLRFPLAVMVVFIHSTKKPIPLNLDLLYDTPLCAENFYNLSRVLLSDVLPAIAVPMFFLFSGRYFFSDCIESFSRFEYIKKLKKKGKSLFIPYIVWNFIAIALFFLVKIVYAILYGGNMNSFIEYLNQNGWINLFWGGHVFSESVNLFNINMQNTSPANIPMWFIRDLMVVMMFSPIIYYFLKKSGLFLIVLFFCYVLNVWIPLSGFSATACFFFSLGAFACIKNIDMIAFCRRIGWLIIPVTIILMLPSILLYGQDSVLRVYSRPFYVLGACISIMMVSSYLIECNIVRNSVFLNKSCFFIFAIHTLFILTICSKVLRFVNPGDGYMQELVSYLCLPVITILCCLGIFKFMERFMPKILCLLTGNR